MNIALWIAQILLALTFAYSGTIKAIWPKDKLIAKGQTGVSPFPPALIRLTAAAELLAAVGLIGPQATGIAPVLTPLAAAGLVVVMLGAMASHASLLRADLAAGRGAHEARNLATNLTLTALAVFVLIGQW
jgi:uncharacterized membrane protein YphA (DoxX/SURF4 family)